MSDEQTTTEAETTDKQQPYPWWRYVAIAVPLMLFPFWSYGVPVRIFIEQWWATT